MLWFFSKSQVLITNSLFHPRITATHTLSTQNHNYYAWLNQRSQILDFEMISEGQFSLSLSLSLSVSIKETIEFWTFRLIAQLKITNPRF